MAVNLDRFAQGLPDPQEREPVVWAVCENGYCREEIYIGDRYFEVDTGEICCSVECVASLVATEKEAF